MASYSLLPFIAIRVALKVAVEEKLQILEQLHSIHVSPASCKKQEESTKHDVMVLCKPEFKREVLKKEKGEIYPSTEKSPRRKRLALVISNSAFLFQRNLRGAEKDELNMVRLLKDLGYDVVLHRNLTAKAMDAAIADFAEREEHFQSDSCFVVIMSHGNESEICGVLHHSDLIEDLFPVDKIFYHLNTLNCPGLHNKPKIILIDSCRQYRNRPVAVQDNLLGLFRKLHFEKDFCCVRSCSPGTSSYINIEKGSPFIQHTVEMFNCHAHENDIEQLFQKIIKKFQETYPKQLPCKERTLSKKFYLFPGL